MTAPSLNYGTILVVAVLTATLLFLVNHVYFSPTASGGSFEKLPSRAAKRGSPPDAPLAQAVAPAVVLPPALPVSMQRQQEGEQSQRLQRKQKERQPQQQEKQLQEKQQEKQQQIKQQQRQQQQQQQVESSKQKQPGASTAPPTAPPPTPTSSSTLPEPDAQGPRQCPPSTSEAYKQPDPLSGRRDAAWCQQMKSQHHVMRGRSWGSLPRDKQREWDKAKCNEQLAMGRLQSCEERWGWSYLSSWLREPKTLVTGQSTVRCGSDIKTSTMCKFSDVVVDFGKTSVRGPNREFDPGFITTFGQRHLSAGAFPELPGLQHVSLAPGQRVSPACTSTETRPVFVMSNDDIYNLCHYFNDVMTVWSMLAMAGIDSRDALFINFDGIRQGGPAGGGPHRLMLPNAPDEHGPFGLYYDSWFQEVKKAQDYGDQRVCFRELYFQPFPGVPWIWNDWSTVNECSLKSPSPLYQSFHQFLLRRWADKQGPTSLSPPPGASTSAEPVHIVVEIRPFVKSKGAASRCRYVANMDRVLDGLRGLEGVRVTAQNLTELSFAEQVKLVHSAGVYISMHGAGTTHLFHSAIGRPNCCALLEMLPDARSGFQSVQGFGNQARMLGMHYFRYEAADGLSRSDGTHVDVGAVVGLARSAVKAVRTKPTCLHDVRDTTKPVALGGGLG